MPFDNITPAWEFNPSHGGGAIVLGNTINEISPPAINDGLIRITVHCRYMRTDGYVANAWTLSDETEDWGANRAEYVAEARNYMLRLHKNLRLIRKPSFRRLSRGHYVMVDHSNSIGTLQTADHGRSAQEFELDYADTDVQLFFQSMCPEEINVTDRHDNMPVVDFDVVFVRPFTYSDLAILS